MYGTSDESLFDEYYETAYNSSMGEKETLVSIFVALFVADGLTPRKREWLFYIGTRTDTLDYVKSQIHESSGRRSEYSGNTSDSEDSLAEYYKILCVDASASDAEVKKAWGKKAKDFHPDYVTGRPVFVQYATDQLKKINEAYDKICKARGMS